MISHLINIYNLNYTPSTITLDRVGHGKPTVENVTKTHKCLQDSKACRKCCKDRFVNKHVAETYLEVHLCPMAMAITFTARRVRCGVPLSVEKSKNKTCFKIVTSVITLGPSR